MSLYRLCPWWSAQCPDLGDNYDALSLHCMRLVDDDGGGSRANAVELLCVGSHLGYLSVYQPQPPDDGSADASERTSDNRNNEGEFDIDVSKQQSNSPVNLVLEVKLEQPILSISSAVMISTASKLRQLIVLHPHSLAIYSLITPSTQPVADQLGDQTTLELCTEHRFRDAAFAVCHGHFGHNTEGGEGGTDRKPGRAEFLCVSHLNGTLTFFEHNGISYECRLPASGGSTGKTANSTPTSSSISCIGMPAPLCYVARVDAFVRCTAAGQLECYRYQDAGECAERDRALEPAWSSCVGEWALDMRVVRTAIDETAIVILGEYNLLCYGDTGALRFVKRLDYTPICIESFLNGQITDVNARLMTAVVTDHGFVLIYAEAALAWCLQLNGGSAAIDARPPVAVCRANLRAMRGAFVTLSAAGRLAVGFLGTLPHPYQSPPVVGADGELDIPHVRRLLDELEADIDETLRLTGDAVVQAALIGKELDVRLIVAADAAAAVSSAAGRCLVSAQLRPSVEHRVDQVQVHFEAGWPLRCARPLHSLRSLGGQGGPASETVHASTVVELEASALSPTVECPASLHVTAVVSFINACSVFRVIEKRVRLPLGRFVQLAAPVKENAAIKVTLTVDGGGEVPTLSALLGSHFGQHPGNPRLDASTHAIGVIPLNYLNPEISESTSSPTVTIVSAKNSSRYRLQCANMTALLPVLVDTIITGLKKPPPAEKSNGAAVSSRVIKMDVQLPLMHFGEALAEHHRARLRSTALQSQLANGTAQMRLIIRRLFVKLDDTKIDPDREPGRSVQDNLQWLFEQTQLQLEGNARKLRASQAVAQRSRHSIHAWLMLLQLAVRYAPTLGAAKRDSLLAVMSAVPCRDWLQRDWVELVHPAVDVLRSTGALQTNDSEMLALGKSGSSDAFECEELMRNFRDVLEAVVQDVDGRPQSEPNQIEQRE